MDCLKGCVNFYNKRGVRTPINEPMIMPWAEVWFEDGFATIGVSNISSIKNKASIKSFTFGMSNGVGLKVEIVDEAGGNFSEFFHRISTGNKVSDAKTQIKMQWGWATADCNGNGITKSGLVDSFTCCFPSGFTRLSCTHTLQIQKLSAQIQNGLFIYTIEAADTHTHITTTRPRSNFGTDNDPSYLRNAIIKLCKEKLNLRVEIKRLATPTCQEVDFLFRQNGEIDPILGPRGRWEVKGRSIIEACIDWLSRYVSDRKKGFTFFFRTNRGVKTIVFMESSMKTCENQFSIDNKNLGTYIVGGKCSPVIQFSPTIEFMPIIMDRLMTKTASVPGGSLASKQSELQGPEECVNLSKISEFQGKRRAYIESDNDYRVFGRDSGQIAGENSMINIHQNNIIVKSPLAAQLQIQGDPYFSNILFCNAGFTVSIVYLNPFTVAKRGSTCDWMANPGCNNILSRSDWRIKGFNHEIREGSYITTLDLFLTAAGLDANPNSPAGVTAGPINPS